MTDAILCAMLQSKKQLKDGIDRFIEEKIVLAAKAISADACLKICDGDVILVYSRLLFASVGTHSGTIIQLLYLISKSVRLIGRNRVTWRSIYLASSLARLARQYFPN